VANRQTRKRFSDRIITEAMLGNIRCKGTLAH